VAVAFILANVWLAVKENMWTWPTGIVGVILYMIINYEAKLYLNAVLQIVYFILSIIGWHEWLRGGVNKTELHVSKTSARAWVGCMLSGIVLTGILWWLVKLTGNSSYPFWDASTTAFSLVGQWMLNEKMLENWIIWIVVDIVYVPLYLAECLPVTALLYAFFCVLCVRGYFEWRRSYAAR
jgi:nicotinamide mononucleotide transporter